jgi:dTDP-4-dehydrorhamnose reductase
MVLIVGVGGMIGKNLFRFFNGRYKGVCGTTHQKEQVGQSTVFHLDLLNPDFGFLSNIGCTVTHAVICSGATGFDECKKDEERSRLLNVTNMIGLFNQLWNKNIVPIFLSTDAVFDGLQGNNAEEDECHPETVYGKQKLEAENQLRAGQKPWLILRLSKVYDVGYQDKTLITSCLDTLLSGQSIRGATDQFIAPIYVGDLCRVVNFLMQEKKRGIFHISLPQAISRKKLSTRIAEYFELDPGLVEACRISDFKFIESRGLHYHLNSNKLQSLGFEYTSIEKSFEFIEMNYRKKC